MSLSKEQMRKRLDGEVIELDDVGVPSLSNETYIMTVMGHT